VFALPLCAGWASAAGSADLPLLGEGGADGRDDLLDRGHAAGQGEVVGIDHETVADGTVDLGPRLADQHQRGGTGLGLRGRPTTASAVSRCRRRSA
jgi:hypothetical protein